MQAGGNGVAGDRAAVDDESGGVAVNAVAAAAADGDVGQRDAAGRVVVNQDAVAGAGLDGDGVEGQRLGVGWPVDRDAGVRRSGAR